MSVDLGEAACLTSGQQSGGRMAEVDGVEITGPSGRTGSTRCSPRRRWACWPGCTGSSTAAGGSCWPPAQRAVRAAGRRRHARLPAGDRGRPGGPVLAGRRPGARAGRPAGGDHRPDRAEDDDQRAQLGRQGVAGRPGGRQHPALGERRRRAPQPRRRAGPDASTSRPAARTYALGDELATIVVRPRGWHLPEKHVLVDGEPMSGSLVDFGLYLVHCGPAAARRRRRARTSTCRRWRATSRPGCGTTSSSPPRSSSASRGAPSGRPC